MQRLDFPLTPTPIRVSGTVRVGVPGIGTGRAEALPHGPPKGNAMRAQKSRDV